MRILKTTALIALLALSGPVFAQTQIFSRGALNGNDFVDWSVLGADLDSVADGAGFTSNGGRTGTVHSGNGANLLRLDQWSNFFGDFTQGDALLQTANSAGPLTIRFSQGVFAVGAQIQANDYGNFTGILELLDINGSVIGSSFQVAGVSSDLNDGSALFLGAENASATIYGARFSVPDSTLPQDFLINRLELRVAPTTGGNTGGGAPTAPVPEPGEWAAMGVLGAGLAGLVVRGRRRRAA